MHKAGRILADILEKLRAEIAVGVTTRRLDELARELVLLYVKEEPDAGIKPGFLGYKPHGNDEPYPAALCTSVNEEVVHCVPSDRVLNEGDIVSIDFGVMYKGYHADAAITVPVGHISPDAKALVEATQKALEKGIKEIKPGHTLGDIGHAVQSYAESKGFAVVRDLVGHGIGRELHEEPYVLNYGTPGTGVVLKPGMVLAIEPMLTRGTFRVRQDGFSWKTADNSLSAHFEHTVAVTKKGHKVLTK